MKNEAWKKRANALKKHTYALYLMSRHPRVSVFAKLLIGIVVAYALSPVDLIPDFVPIVGYLDDLLILSLGIWFALRLVPKDVWAECQRQAGERVSELPRNRRAATVIVIIWLLAIVAVVLWVGVIPSDTKSI